METLFDKVSLKRCTPGSESWTIVRGCTGIGKLDSQHTRLGRPAHAGPPVTLADFVEGGLEGRMSTGQYKIVTSV